MPRGGVSHSRTKRRKADSAEGGIGMGQGNEGSPHRRDRWTRSAPGGRLMLALNSMTAVAALRQCRVPTAGHFGCSQAR